MGKTTKSRTFRIAVLAIAAVGLLAATAWAGVKPFAGAMTSNDAPVRFDATKKDGKYKTVTHFTIGNETTGVPIHCDTTGNQQVPVEAGDTFYVASDGSFRGISDGGDVVKGTINGKKASGTVKVSFEAYYPNGSSEHCQSNGKEPWTATIAG